MTDLIKTPEKWLMVPGDSQKLNDIFYESFTHYNKLLVQCAIWKLEFAYNEIKKNRACSFVINNKEEIAQLTDNCIITKEKPTVCNFTLMRRSGDKNEKIDDLKIFKKAIDFIPDMYAHLFFDFEFIKEKEDRFKIYKKITETLNIDPVFYDSVVKMKKTPQTTIAINGCVFPSVINKPETDGEFQDIKDIEFQNFTYFYIVRDYIEMQKNIIDLFYKYEGLKNITITNTTSNLKKESFYLYYIKKNVSTKIDIDCSLNINKKEIEDLITKNEKGYAFNFTKKSNQFIFNENMGVSINKNKISFYMFTDYQGVYNPMVYEETVFVNKLFSELENYNNIKYQQKKLTEIITPLIKENKVIKRI